MWLTHVLCADHEDARVVGHTLDDPDDGMTNRRRIFVEYNQAGTSAGLPGSVFCKASTTLDVRLMNGIGGLVRGEVAFYNDYQDRLEIETPSCSLAAYDPESFKSIVVLEDLAPRGVTFCTHTTDVTRERAESQMALLARLHGPFHDRHTATGDEVPTFEQLFFNIDAIFDWAPNCSAGFIDAEEAIPPRLYARYDEVWPRTLEAVALHATQPRTLAHNDVHLRQLVPDRRRRHGTHRLAVLRPGVLGSRRRLHPRHRTDRREPPCVGR